MTDRGVLSMAGIWDFAMTVDLDDVCGLLERQVACNAAVADEGLAGDWGANIGSVMLGAYGDDVKVRACACAAAASDARMSGCELPVVINSGSGNPVSYTHLDVYKRQDRECVVFGESTLALRAWMRAQGIARLVDDKTPEDHIGLMLVLMAWIARNQPADLDDYLRLHLLPWSPHFLDELAEAAKQPFYEGLARLAKASLEGIQSERALDVAYPRFYR